MFNFPLTRISWLRKKQNVSTWSYVSVHVYGKAKIITDQAELFSVLEMMIDNFEKDYKAQWDKLPLEYKSKMLNGIVIFQISVEDMQAKKKLSQNIKEAERQEIISAFKKNNNNEKTIAELMKQNEEYLE